MVPTEYYLIVSAILFGLGALGVLIRRNPLVMFMSVEMMLNAANLAFVAFAHQLQSMTGQIFVFFVITVAAAEVTVGLAIIVAIFRMRENVDVTTRAARDERRLTGITDTRVETATCHTTMASDMSCRRRCRRSSATGPRITGWKSARYRQPGPEEVVVRVKLAGICASDLKCFLGAALFWGDADRTGYCQPPVIPGHEFVGEVVALGEGAGEEVWPADRRPGDLRADRALRRVPLLQERPVLDVPDRRRLRLPPEGLWRDGRVHALPAPSR